MADQAQILNALAGAARGFGNVGQTLYEREQARKKEERDIAQDAIKKKYMMAAIAGMGRPKNEMWLTDEDRGPKKESKKYKDKLFGTLLKLREKKAEGKWEGSDEDFDMLEDELIRAMKSDTPLNVMTNLQQPMMQQAPMGLPPQAAPQVKRPMANFMLLLQQKLVDYLGRNQGNQ